MGVGDDDEIHPQEGFAGEGVVAVVTLVGLGLAVVLIDEDFHFITGIRRGILNLYDQVEVIRIIPARLEASRHRPGGADLNPGQHLPQCLGHPVHDWCGLGNKLFLDQHR